MIEEKPFIREPERLEELRYDVLVIGGGINGAAVAWDAAVRGLNVALVEKSDFSSGASSGCFKIIHGGIRYLQHMELPRLFESAGEQKILRMIAPHLVHPFPFLIPCYGWGKRSKWFLRLGMMVYELLTLSRNAEIGQYHKLPLHQVLSRDECLEIAPGLPQEGLTGGVVYYDCQMSNCERLTLAVARAASRSGAVVCNYMQAEAAEVVRVADGERMIDAVQVRDLENGGSYRVRARYVVNAAGPWIAKTLKQLGLEECAAAVTAPETPYSKGVQIVLPKFISDFGVALETKYGDSARVLARGGRSYFVFPWRGRSLVGTTDSLSSEDPDNFDISEQEIRDLLGDLKAAYSLDEADIKDVVFAFGGFRPLDKKVLRCLKKGTADQNAAGVSREDRIINHSRAAAGGITNLVSVEGVKYTTFRALAVKAVNLINKTSRVHNRRTRTHRDILPGGDVGNFGRYLRRLHGILDRGFDPATIDYLIKNYGTDAEDILILAADRPELGEYVLHDPPCIKAEVVFMARNEMVCRLSDIILRRAGLGLTGCPDDAVLAELAMLTGQELGWSPERVQQEIENTKAEFLKLGIKKFECRPQ